MVGAQAVYTALLGGYEELNEQAIAASSTAKFICFTDDPALRSDSWQLVLVEPLFPLDLVRSQRDIKIRGHERLDDFAETLYIDNSVTLRETPERILETWLQHHDFAAPLHSYRRRVVDEFDAVVTANYDDSARVHEQLMHYARLAPEVLDEHPSWNGMLARRPTERVYRAMQLWFDHVLRYSRRDQLSLNMAATSARLSVNRVELDNRDSPVHHWPTELQRRDHMKLSPAKSGPLLSEIARLERELERYQDSLADAQRQFDSTRRMLEAVEAARVAGESDWKRRWDEVMASSSWRLSAPVRWAGARLGRARRR